MNKLMKSLCGTLWIALMCQSCDSAESYDPPIDLQKSCVVERIGDALYVLFLKARLSVYSYFRTFL